MTFSPVQSLSAFLSATKQTVSLGAFAVPRRVVRVHVEVTQAFNSDGTDQIRVGHRTDDDAYMALLDVSTTGIKTAVLGTGIGYDATPREILAEYVNGGSEPTTGKVVITLEYVSLPLSL